jgi:hypothetical protein
MIHSFRLCHAAKPVLDANTLKELLYRQVTAPVMFEPCVLTAVNDFLWSQPEQSHASPDEEKSASHDVVFLEMGPGAVVGNLIQNIISRDASIASRLALPQNFSSHSTSSTTSKSPSPSVPARKPIHAHICSVSSADEFRAFMKKPFSKAEL